MMNLSSTWKRASEALYNTVPVLSPFCPDTSFAFIVPKFLITTLVAVLNILQFTSPPLCTVREDLSDTIKVPEVDVILPPFRTMMSIPWGVMFPFTFQVPCIYTVALAPL